MKTFKVLVILFILISCENNQKEIEPLKEGSEDIKDELRVKIKYKTNKSDEFRLSLNHIKLDEFQSKSIHIIEKVEPTTNSDNITANFGKGNFSNRFQFGLGNIEPKKVTLEEIHMSYKDKNLIIESDQINEYFRFNEFVEYDSISHQIRTKRVDGKHFPVLSLKWKYLTNLSKTK
jgi:hypothetical protein